MSASKNTTTIQRLTALWALGESGLGGWMHALKLPFTGVFVGGFAVVIIALLAHYSRNNIRIMLQSLMLVLLVKFTVSPQSPVAAYLAVAFQGLIGAVLYRLIASFPFASVVFAFIAMLESALQKIIIMTLIFGKSLWDAIDAFFAGILKDFSMSKDYPFSYWIIGAYLGIYALWGLILGIWIAGLPKRIETRAMGIQAGYKELPPELISVPAATKKKKGKNWFLPLTLVFVVIILLYAEPIKDYSKVTYVVLRTFAVIFFLFGILNPFIRWVLQKWLNSRSKQQHNALQMLLQMQPELKALLNPSWQLAKTGHKGLSRYPAFILNLVVLTLHPIYNEPTTEDIHTQPANT